MQLSSHICVWEGKLISCWTLISVRTRYWDVQTDANLNSSKLQDTDGRLGAWQGCPDGSLDPTSLTWNLHRIFFELLKAHFWNEDSEINGIPNKMATLHKSNFVKQNAANHKLTLILKLRLDWSPATIHILMLNLITSDLLNSFHVCSWSSYACGMNLLFMSMWMAESWS
jgi:hypothetical protein